MQAKLIKTSGISSFPCVATQPNQPVPWLPGIQWEYNYWCRSATHQSHWSIRPACVYIFLAVKMQNAIFETTLFYAISTLVLSHSSLLIPQIKETVLELSVYLVPGKLLFVMTMWNRSWFKCIKVNLLFCSSSICNIVTISIKHTVVFFFTIVGYLADYFLQLIPMYIYQIMR